MENQGRASSSAATRGGAPDAHFGQMLQALGLLALAGIGLLASPVTSQAQWQSCGVALTSKPAYGPRITSDAAGGAIVAWVDYRTVNADIYVRRINSSGVPQWAADGLPLATGSNDQNYPSIAADGSGGAIVAWTDNGTPYAQRVNSSGAILWTSGGLALSPIYASNMTVVPDGAGGAIFVWFSFVFGQVYAQRVNPSGSTRWGPTGLQVTTGASVNPGAPGVYEPAAVSDGAGGVIVAWEDTRGSQGDIYVQRIVSLDDTTGAAVWTPDGVPLCTATDIQALPYATLDGAGGAIVAWQDGRTGGVGDIYAQRVNASGSPLWTANGVAICSASNTQQNVRTVSDGSGGIIAAWEDLRTGSVDVYAQHVNAAGTILWTSAGVAITTATGDQQSHRMAADGLGGAIITWADARSGNQDIYAQQVSTFGDPLLSTNGEAVCIASNAQEFPAIVSATSSNAIVAWYDERTSSFDANIYAQLVDGVTYADHCDLAHEWRRGMAIELFGGVTYWPNGSGLSTMRPGDVIALSARADDPDYLLVTCTDCSLQPRTVPWGPYADLVTYEWSLRSSGEGGRIVEPITAENNTILYQLPLLGWKDGEDYAAQSDTVLLTVKNNPAGGKAMDPPHVGTRIVITATPCAGYGGEYLEVTVGVQLGSAPPGEVVTPSGTGTCLPTIPTWLPETAISAAAIGLKDAPDLCPDYLTLLSVDPVDADSAELRCNPQQSGCLPPLKKTGARDKHIYSWSLVNGQGVFPLGTSGPTVAFERSRSSDATVQCVIANLGHQVYDSPVTLTRTVLKAKPPKALVAIGDDAWRSLLFNFGGHAAALTEAADTAKVRYERAGYEVEYDAGATKHAVRLAMRSPCYQAIWMVGHGAAGTIMMNPSPEGDAVVPLDLVISTNAAWGRLDSHPFVRELIALGCNTYSPDWLFYLTCGRAFSMNHYMIAGGIGYIAGVHPGLWENTTHFPLPAHNWSAP